MPKCIFHYALKDGKYQLKRNLTYVFIFYFEKLLKIWFNIKKIHKPALIISTKKIEGISHETMTIDKQSGKHFMYIIHI